MESSLNKSPIKIPIFEEISIEDFSEASVRQALKTKNVGLTPYYIATGELQGQKLEEALDNIYQAIRNLQLTPYFPYPLYVVTEYMQYHPYLLMASSVQDLPRHFFKKSRRLKNKESALLNKNMMMASKIINDKIEEKIRIVKNRTRDQRELFDITKEADFYQRILGKLEGRDHE